jgi:hypothetical protein
LIKANAHPLNDREIVILIEERIKKEVTRILAIRSFPEESPVKGICGEVAYHW